MVTSTRSPVPTNLNPNHTTVTLISHTLTIPNLLVTKSPDPPLDYVYTAPTNTNSSPCHTKINPKTSAIPAIQTLLQIKRTSNHIFDKWPLKVF